MTRTLRPAVALVAAGLCAGCEWVAINETTATSTPDRTSTATPTASGTSAQTPSTTEGTPTPTPTPTEGADSDEDGYPASRDCDDTDEDIYPGAPEQCDRADGDCDGVVDEAVGEQWWWKDNDGDGYGAEGTIGALQYEGCDALDIGWVPNGDDCDDNAPGVNPDASEIVCNGVDENCSGAGDDHPDEDADGYDVCAVGVTGADGLPVDCDDARETVNPGEQEGDSEAAVDNNCDGVQLVPGGPFVMGSDEEEGQDDERPEHLVTVPAFQMPIREVTVAEFKACVTAGTCAAPPVDIAGCNYYLTGRDSHPMNCVSWFQAEVYCASIGWRLPTEAEWERAARGSCDSVSSTGCSINPSGPDNEGDEQAWPWPRTVTESCEVANYTDAAEGACAGGTTAPVGSYPAGESPAGILDMAGNVAEWVADCYHTTYDGAPADGSAWSDGCVADVAVARGGSFASGLDDVRTSARATYAPALVSAEIGVRCAKDD